MTKDFPYNKVLVSIDYDAVTSIMKLVYRKKIGVEERVYEDVPKEVACPMFYKDSAKELLSYYAKKVKKKFKIKQIK